MKFGRFLLWFLSLCTGCCSQQGGGPGHVPSESEGPVILCCNHISLLDPVYLLMSQKAPCVFHGQGGIAGGTVQALVFCQGDGRVSRQARYGGHRCHRYGGAAGEGRQDDGDFPRGTRSKDGKLGRGKSGAALIVSRTGAKVLPVAIKTKDQKARMFRRVTVIYGGAHPL